MPKSKSAPSNIAYKSPETMQNPRVSDQYRSDIFSLGMTLLSMASLQLFSDALQSPNWVENADLIVEGLAYSDNFKMILRKMLCRDAAMRPDFKEMKKLLRKQRFRESEFAESKASHHMETLRFTHLNSLFAGWKSSAYQAKMPNCPLNCAELAEDQDCEA